MQNVKGMENTKLLIKSTKNKARTYNQKQQHQHTQYYLTLWGLRMVVCTQTLPLSSHLTSTL